VSGLAAEETEALFEMMFAFFVGKLAVLAEFGREVRRPFRSAGVVRRVVLGVLILLVIRGRVGVGTRIGFALVVGTVVLGLGVFTSYFGASFPITSVNRLDEGSEVGKVVGFAYAGNLVFDSGGKSIVELLSECGIAPLDSSCKVVEFDEVFGDTLVVAHPEVFNFCFGFPFRIVGSKVRLELGDEFIVVIEPIRC